MICLFTTTDLQATVDRADRWLSMNNQQGDDLTVSFQALSTEERTRSRDRDRERYQRKGSSSNDRSDSRSQSRERRQTGGARDVRRGSGWSPSPRGRQQQRRSDDSNRQRRKTCFHCGKPGHFYMQCYDLRRKMNSSAGNGNNF